MNAYKLINIHVVLSLKKYSGRSFEMCPTRTRLEIIKTQPETKAFKVNSNYADISVNLTPSDPRVATY